MKHNSIQKFVFLIFLLSFSGATLAHSGSHTEHGAVSAIIHSVTSLSHMGIALVTGILLVLLLPLLRSVRLGKRRIGS